MPCEFVCCECQASVVSFGADKPPEPPLCATCLHVPGWMNVPELRGLLGRGSPQAQCPTCGELVDSIFDHVDIDCEHD